MSIAKKNGVEVPEGPLTKGLDYFHAQLRDPKTPYPAKAFGAYILALNHRLERDEFKGLRQNYQNFNREGQLLLLLAAREADLLPVAELQRHLKPLLGPDLAKQTSWSHDEFNALARGPALALLAGKAIMPEDPLTKEAALVLLGGLDQQGVWISTSSTGWALVALGEYFQGQKFSSQGAEFAISQPGATAKQRIKLDPKGFRTVDLDPRALLKNPVVQAETQPAPPGSTSWQLAARGWTWPPPEPIRASRSARPCRIPTAPRRSRWGTWSRSRSWWRPGNPSATWSWMIPCLPLWWRSTLP